MIRKLGEIFGGNGQEEIGTQELGNTIELPCYNEHMMDANGLMTEQYTGDQLLRIMLGLQEFTQEIVTVNSMGSTCNESERIIEYWLKMKFSK